MKEELQKKRSGDYAYRVNDAGEDTTNNTDDADHKYKVGTLDPGLEAGRIKHQLRPLLRSKYLEEGIEGHG